jgi:hypothetical protein
VLSHVATRLPTNRVRAGRGVEDRELPAADVDASKVVPTGDRPGHRDPKGPSGSHFSNGEVVEFYGNRGGWWIRRRGDDVSREFFD